MTQKERAVLASLRKSLDLTEADALAMEHQVAWTRG